MKNTSAPRRTVLTEQEAVGIYRRKPQDANFKGVPTRNSKSRLPAVHFGVSPKTVRDIWNQKRRRGARRRRVRRGRIRPLPRRLAALHVTPLLTHGARNIAPARDQHVTPLLTHYEPRF